MNSKKLTVIIITFNDILFTENIIFNVNKLLKVQYVSKIIIWDDGSDVKNAINKYLFIDNEKLFFSGTKDNHGPYSSRFHALKLADTDYVWFIDSDDQILDLPHDLIGDLMIFDFLGCNLSNSEENAYEKGTSGHIYSEIITEKNSCVAWNKIFSKKTLISLSPNYFRNGDDLYMVLTALKNANEIKYIKIPIIKYYIRSNSLSRKFRHGRLLDIGKVISILKKENTISYLDAFIVWKNYIFRNYLRSIIRYKNPIISETKELIVSIKCLF